MQNFELGESEVYRCAGPVNLHRVNAIYDQVDRPDLKFPKFTPRVILPVVAERSMFEAIAEHDILLHHPFESFSAVIELIKQASTDPGVLAIKQTLYRTGPDSPLVNLLIDAARAGKDVTVVVELRARFDEEANIVLANRLQEAGVQVVYGVVGYKTHAKMLLIVRREKGGLRRYVHLSTGNYHQVTSRLYTDFGLMTADLEIGHDAHKLFQQISGLGPVIQLKRLLQSPFSLYKGVMRMIEREIAHAQAGKPARLIAKINALNEPSVVELLYKASCAGVQIDLIVRSACTLRPGVPGVSENIRVRSIVGRFLEHSRVYWFAQCRRAGNLLFQRGLDGTQSAAPNRGVFSDSGRNAGQARVRRGIAKLSRRQRASLDIARRRPLRTGLARRRRTAFRAALAVEFALPVAAENLR